MTYAIAVGAFMAAVVLLAALIVTVVAGTLGELRKRERPS